MPYASQQDIVDQYGMDLLLRVSDHDKDGYPDENIVAQGLRSADEICDAYLSAQYTVPVTPTPGVVRTCAIDIAVYRMAMDRPRRTEEMKVRYDEAIKLLEKISTGKAGLGLPPVDPDGDDGPSGPVDPNIKRRGRIFDIGRG